MYGKLGYSLLILLLEAWCIQSLALDTVVGVSSALQIHFHSGCVFLTSLNDYDLQLTKSLVQLQVQLAEKHIASATLNAVNFHRLLQNFICHHNRALVVIWCTGDHIHRYLQQDPPFDALEEEDGVLIPKGIFPELIRHLCESLNFSVSVQRAPGNSGGTLQNNGSWSGVTGMILAKRVNITVNDFYVTISRNQVVDYTVPVLETRYCIYIRTPDSSDARWEALIQPFRRSLWLAIGCCILVTVFFLVATHTFEKTVRGSEYYYSTWQALLNVWGSFCSQGVSNLPTLWSGRLVHWTSLVTGLVLLAAYSGNFISFLTVPRIHLPFTDLQGILHDDSYTFLVKARSTLFRNFQDANNTIMKEVYRRKLLAIKDSLPPTIMDAFHRMCKQRSAFMIDCGYMRNYRKKIPCRFSHLPDGSFRVVLAFMLPKRSPYKGVLDHRLQQMIRSGLVRKLYQAFLADTETSEDKQQAKSVELQAAVPLLALVCVGIICTVIILFFEVYIGHRKKNMRVYPY